MCGSLPIGRSSDIGEFTREAMMHGQPQRSPNPPATLGDRRLLCLGGSFNPIHVGHLITARAAAETLGLPGVRLIPTAGNPHKIGQDVASAEDRFEMCQLAVAGDPFFIVDPVELRRPPPSYTFDTVTALAGGSDSRIHWLIGTDLLPKLHTWHRFDELIDRVAFIVMRRPTHPLDLKTLDPSVAALAERSVVVPQIELSATELRARVRVGNSIDYLVPPPVASFIETHRLYR